ncbi:MAG TPA: DUF4037 domain-containing protein [Mycobacteriales bacterium]
MGSPFLPGRELGSRFYAEAVRPLLDARFPELPYAAAHIGPGSDVLGFDTTVSTDHDWGSAVTVFLREEDAGWSAAVRGTLLDRLPREFDGHPVRTHRVTTVRGFAQERLGADPLGPLTPADWLSFPTQALLELTGGIVHHDAVGEFTALRQRLAWYPDDVWRYVLAASWTRFGQEEHLMPRAGQVGDELGSAVIGGRLARDAMALAFQLERRWAPYPKWFGTAFARLDSARVLAPRLAELVSARSWPERQDAYAGAAEQLLARQAALDLTDPLPPRAEIFHGRPFWVIRGDRVAAALLRGVTDPEVLWLAREPVIGSVDQWSDSTDLKSPPWRPAVRRVYRPEE